MSPFSEESYTILKEILMVEYILRLEGLIGGSPLVISRLMKDIDQLITKAKAKGLIPLTTMDVLSFIET